MPAKSDKQRKMMAIAEHAPDRLYAKNKGVLGMSQDQLHDFAATKNAPKKAKKSIMHGNTGTGHAYNFREQVGKRAPKRMATTK